MAAAEMLYAVIAGVAAGWLADRLIPDGRFRLWGDILAGIAGAYFAGNLAVRLFDGRGDALPIAATLVGAIVGILAIRKIK